MWDWRALFSATGALSLGEENFVKKSSFYTMKSAFAVGGKGLTYTRKSAQMFGSFANRLAYGLYIFYFP